MSSLLASGAEAGGQARLDALWSAAVLRAPDGDASRSLLEDSDVVKELCRRIQAVT